MILRRSARFALLAVAALLAGQARLNAKLEEDQDL